VAGVFVVGGTGAALGEASGVALATGCFCGFVGFVASAVADGIVVKGAAAAVGSATGPLPEAGDAT
jgi:hypothetical protein